MILIECIHQAFNYRVNYRICFRELKKNGLYALRLEQVLVHLRVILPSGEATCVITIDHVELSLLLFHVRDNGLETRPVISLRGLNSVAEFCDDNIAYFIGMVSQLAALRVDTDVVAVSEAS